MTIVVPTTRNVCFRVWRDQCLQNNKRQLYLQMKTELVDTVISKKSMGYIANAFQKKKLFLREEGIHDLDTYVRYVRKHPVEIANLLAEPTKQGFDEQAQLLYYQLLFGHELHRLPTRGKKALCFHIGADGNPTTIGSTINKSMVCGERTKTFDAKYENEMHTYYYFLKYVSAPGGAQENQIRDLIHMIQVADKYIAQNPNSPFRFVGILDGVFKRCIFEKAAYSIQHKNEVMLMTSSISTTRV